MMRTQLTYLTWPCGLTRMLVGRQDHQLQYFWCPLHMALHHRNDAKAETL